MAHETTPLKVVHLLDAAGGDGQLWGKERVTHWLMQAQKGSGEIEPILRTLTPKLLNEVAERSGIESSYLAEIVSKDPRPYVAGLRKTFEQHPGAILHTHGYKANVMGRIARWAGVPMAGLVATCHGFVETTRSLRLYNAVDRWTARWSDAVTVPAPNMKARLPASTIFLPNGIPDAPVPSPETRESLRAKLQIGPNMVAAGTLGRLSAEKGIDVLLDAVRQTREMPNLVWVVAGTGPLAGELERAQQSFPHLKFIGYVEGSDGLLPALDIFVQPSWTEGLSLALLEAARGGLAMVATRVGATDWAVRDGQEAILVEKGESDRLAAGVTALASDGLRRQSLGRAARSRFDETLSVDAMHRRLRDIYLDVVRRRNAQTR